MTTTKKTRYEILGLSKTCGAEEVRRAYRDLVLRLHPDKRKVDQQPTAEAEAEADEEFQEVQKAYEVLSNLETRREYDRQLLYESISSAAISEEVDLEDMELAEVQEDSGDSSGASTTSYSWPCRCGGRYLISEAELEEGIEVISCSGCSLNIRVLYELLPAS